MIEKSVVFKSGDLQIEGLYAAAGGDHGVVVSHPHPQMGGSMINNVVEALTRSYYTCGYSTLRFNFRGVGRSEGSFDNGTGEQEDMLGAVEFLLEKGIKKVSLGGYSFGAWISVRVLAHGGDFLPAVLVSPPVDFLPFSFSGLEGKVGLIVCGDRDEFCKVDRLKKIAAGTGARLRIVSGADHFFSGWEEALTGCIKDHLLSQ